LARSTAPCEPQSRRPSGFSGRTAALCCGSARSAISRRAICAAPPRARGCFALTNLAAADAQIACWHCKETFNFWRPVTAISLGGGIPNLEADPNWKPLINTPNFPEYTSGHTTSSAAAVGVLKRFFHDRDTTFTVTSKYPWSLQTQRTFDRFDDALDEVIDARVWVGIHWRTSDVDGAMWGKKIANYSSRAICTGPTMRMRAIAPLRTTIAGRTATTPLIRMTTAPTSRATNFARLPA